MSDREIAIVSLWASIVGSVGTVAALAVAIWLGVREVKALRVESVRRDDDLRAAAGRDRRKQAEAVSAQLNVDVKTFNPNFFRDLPHGPDTLHHTWVDVHNTSGSPIYQVHVIVPHRSRRGYVTESDLPMVAGGQVGHAHVAEEPDRTRDRIPVTVTFRDAAGVPWLRQSSGELLDLERHGHGPDCRCLVPSDNASGTGAPASA